MTDREPLSAADLEKLSALDACTVSNAIERLDVRLRNEGFVSGAVSCRFPNLGAMVGYAVTGRIRTTGPPIGHRCYHDRMDWWTYITTIPEPRIMVLQDLDHLPGSAAFVGEIHASIGKALKCVGCVTNGAVCDLPPVQALGFHLFSGSVCASHSYSHIVDFGEPVEIGGLKISPGDLLHGDRHGVVCIPREIAAQVPEEANKILEEERQLIEYCRSKEFSLEGLAARVQASNLVCDLPRRPR
jgi:regulator of RNase E activity RraA